MERKNFLEGLLALSLGYIKPAPQGKHKLCLLETKVAGFRYHEGPDLINGMETGEAIKLKRDRDNEHDPRAIALYYKGSMIGFIPQFNNGIISKLMDAGTVELFAEIVEVEPHVAPWEALTVGVFMMVDKEVEMVEDKQDEAKVVYLNGVRYREDKYSAVKRVSGYEGQTSFMFMD